MAPSAVLDLNEIGKRLGVGRRTVYRLIAAGDLRAVNVSPPGSAGKRPRMRVREDDLAAFIESRTVEPVDTDDIVAAG